MHQKSCSLLNRIMFLYITQCLKIFGLAAILFLTSGVLTWAEEIKVNPFFLRPEIVEVRQEHVGGQHGATFSIYKQNSKTLELIPGLIFYEGTEYWTMKDHKSYIDRVDAPKGFTFRDALFKKTDDSIKFDSGTIMLLSGVTETDQYVTFPGLKEKRIKALKGSVVEFNKRVVLAENTVFDSGNEKSIQNHPNMVAKAKTEVEFFPKSDGSLTPSLLVLAEPYDFGNLLVPADSTVGFYNGRLNSIFSPKLWTAQKINIPDWTIVHTEYSSRPEKYVLQVPAPSKKLDFSQYTHFHCGNKTPMTVADVRPAPSNMNCHFTLTTDLIFEGVALKKGCLVEIEWKDGKLLGFNCPEKYEFSGLTFDKESTVKFGQPYLTEEMVEALPKACVTGKDLKFMSAHFYDTFCVFFDKDRKPEYLWSKNNILLGSTTYFGPVLLKVTAEKLIPVSSSNKNSDTVDLEKSEDPILPLCTKGVEIVVYSDKNLKNSSFSLPSCSSTAPSIDSAGVEYFYIQSKKKGVWQIQRAIVDDRNPVSIIAGEIFWFKEVKDLSTPTFVKIGSVEIMAPVLVTENEANPSLRVRYADDEYIYLQGDLGGCYPANKRVFRLPRPKNLKIENRPATLVPQYQIPDYMCNT